MLQATRGEDELDSCLGTHTHINTHRSAAHMHWYTPPNTTSQGVHRGRKALGRSQVELGKSSPSQQLNSFPSLFLSKNPPTPRHDGVLCVLWIHPPLSSGILLNVLIIDSPPKTFCNGHEIKNLSGLWYCWLGDKKTKGQIFTWGWNSYLFLSLCSDKQNLNVLSSGYYRLWKIVSNTLKISAVRTKPVMDKQTMMFTIVTPPILRAICHS